jgi:trimeric autotransporter adhesin
MAVTNFSPLLGLALPTTGDLQGTWGTTVNDSITNLIDSAVAGTTTLSVDTDVTLSTTNGAANQARNAIILWTASNGATTRNITAPAQSKAYLVINAGTGSIVIRGSGPTTGVIIPSGTRALVAWNGSDFVKIVSNPVALTTDVTGTLPIANGGTGTTSTTFANLATNVTGTLPVANGGTGQTSYTDGQLLIGNTATGGLSKATLTAGSNVTVTNGNGTITISATGGGSGGVTAGQSITYALIFGF